MSDIAADPSKQLPPPPLVSSSTTEAGCRGGRNSPAIYRAPLVRGKKTKTKRLEEAHRWVGGIYRIFLSRDFLAKISSEETSKRSATSANTTMYGEPPTKVNSKLFLDTIRSVFERWVTIWILGVKFKYLGCILLF